MDKEKRDKILDLDRRYSFDERAIAKLESRADGDEGELPLIVGYAAVFYREDNPGTEFDLFGDGEYFEHIMPGAFDSALERGDDVRGLFNHDPNLLLGRNKSGTLRLSVDDVGLKYEIDPPDTQVARDLITSIKRGDVTGSSFGFVVKSQAFREKDNLVIREIEDLELLFDVSPVTYPAYTATQAQLSERSLRSVQDFRKSTRSTSRLNMAKRQLEILKRR